MKDLTRTITERLIEKIRNDELQESDHRELIESLEYMLELHQARQALKEITKLTEGS